ncbi:hypothetical protein [uncultured Desulfosarcina sp.]|uniref:hypothetical protein n=1 Tax=uncultured Desulfosarcina sp. TaxID=218289 RepID=UPI0029C6322F|nr:hypothetical protein [uncultured Desulfosarcina sp.]
MGNKGFVVIAIFLFIFSGCSIGYKASIKRSDKIYERPESAKSIVSGEKFPYLFWYDESKWNLVEPVLPISPEGVDPVSSGDPTSPAAFGSTEEGDRWKTPMEAAGETLFEHLAKVHGPSLNHVFLHKHSWQDLNDLENVEAALRVGGGIYAFLIKRRIPVSYESVIRKESRSIKDSHISYFDSEIRSVNYREMLYLSYGMLTEDSVNIKVVCHIFTDRNWSVYLWVVTPATLYEMYENDINDFMNGLGL